MSEDLPLLQFGGVPMRPSQTGYSTRDPYGAVVTNIPGGMSVIGTDHLSGVYEVTATYQLDAVQYLYWGAFYHTTLKEGSMPFRAELSLDTPLIQEYVCQIVGQPSKPRFLGSGYTEVTLQLEAEPIIDDAYNDSVVDVVGGLGYDASAVLNLFDIYANEWCPTYLRPDFGVMLDFITRRYTRDGHAVNLSSLLSFSRSSTGANFVGGILTEFAADIPRVGDGGLLVERESTNLISDSSGVTGTAKGSGATWNTTSTGIDGKNTSLGVSGMYGISYSSSGGCLYRTGLPATLGANSTFSAYLINKSQVDREFQARISVPDNRNVTLIKSGDVGRLAVTTSPSGSTVSIGVGTRSDSIIADAVICALQLEELPYATSPILTNGSIATRQRDVSTVALPSDTNTAIAEYEWDGLSYERTIFNLGDDTAAHRITVKHRPSGFIELTASEFGVVQATATYPAPSSAGASKVAVSYSDSEIIFAVNGQSVAIQIATPITSLTTLNVGQSYGATEPLNAHVRRVYLKSERYSLAELAQATS